MNLVDGWITRLARCQITRRQDDGGAHDDRPPPESAQRRTFKRDEFDVVRFGNWMFIGNELRQYQLERRSVRRFEIMRSDNRTAEVAGPHVGISKRVIHIQHGHDLIVARWSSRECSRISDHVSSDFNRLPWSEVAHLLRGDPDLVEI